MSRAEKIRTKMHEAGSVPRDLAKAEVAEVVTTERVDPKRFLPKLVVMKTTIRGVTPLIVENFGFNAKKSLDAFVRKYEQLNRIFRSEKLGRVLALALSAAKELE